MTAFPVLRHVDEVDTYSTFIRSLYANVSGAYDIVLHFGGDEKMTVQLGFLIPTCDPQSTRIRFLKASRSSQSVTADGKGVFFSVQGYDECLNPVVGLPAWTISYPSDVYTYLSPFRRVLDVQASAAVHWC